MSRSLRAMREKVESWLSQGISPQRLALTLALGFAIGCLPMIGIPTALCLVIALGLRLNIPAIQAANYAAMPLQIALIFPFVRLGRWMFASGNHARFERGMLPHLPAEGDLGLRQPGWPGIWRVVCYGSADGAADDPGADRTAARVPVLAKAEAGD